MVLNSHRYHHSRYLRRIGRHNHHTRCHRSDHSDVCSWLKFFRRWRVCSFWLVRKSCSCLYQCCIPYTHHTQSLHFPFHYLDFPFKNHHPYQWFHNSMDYAGHQHSKLKSHQLRGLLNNICTQADRNSKISRIPQMNHEDHNHHKIHLQLNLVSHCLNST